VRGRPYVRFSPRATAREVLEKTGEAGEWQDVFPVLHDDGRLLGVITSDVLRTLATNPGASELTLAVDLMGPSASIRESEDVHAALELMLASGLRELIVLDAAGVIAGFLDEAEVHALYHRATSQTRSS
jgi:CIC family chloride channel protein